MSAETEKLTDVELLQAFEQEVKDDELGLGRSERTPILRAEILRRMGDKG
jgi:hypothetical protein